jgi:hypothetical protein
MRHCFLVSNFNFKSIYTDVSSVGPFSCVHALALVHDVVFTHPLAGTHVLACVSEVIGSSVAGIVAL